MRLVFCFGKNCSYFQLPEFLPVNLVWHINRFLNIKKPWDTVLWKKKQQPPLPGALGLNRNAFIIVLYVCIICILPNIKNNKGLMFSTLLFNVYFNCLFYTTCSIAWKINQGTLQSSNIALMAIIISEQKSKYFFR